MWKNFRTCCWSSSNLSPPIDSFSGPNGWKSLGTKSGLYEGCGSNFHLIIATFLLTNSALCGGTWNAFCDYKFILNLQTLACLFAAVSMGLSRPTFASPQRAPAASYRPRPIAYRWCVRAAFHYSIASCKPGQKPGRKQVERMSKASCELA